MKESELKYSEDQFLLDYIEWQKGNMHISDYAKKYNMTVWELQDKLREHRFSISNIRR